MWHNLSENPESLTSLFTEVPQLRKVAIHQITLHRDGPLMKIWFDLPRFPDRPPSRWNKEFNTAQIELDFILDSPIDLKGWATENIVDIELNKLPNGSIAVEIRSTPLTLTTTCLAFRIAKVVGYLSE